MIHKKHISDLMSRFAMIVQDIERGLLNVNVVHEALGGIMEDDITQGWRAPSWWMTLQQQRDHAFELWPYAVLPEVPDNAFEGLKDSEVVVLHVPDSIENLWGKIDPPSGFTKHALDRAPLLDIEVETPVASWVVIDLEYGRNQTVPESVEAAQAEESYRPAGAELLSLVIQCPEWLTTRDDTGNYPNAFLGAYLTDDDFGRFTPSISAPEQTHEFRMSGIMGEVRHPNRTSPLVRNLSAP